MRGFWVISAVIAATTAGAEVHYFDGSSAAVPAGHVSAVEVRASCREARIGSNRAAGWCISWPGAELRLEFDMRNVVDGISEPDVKVICGQTHGRIPSGINLSGGFNSIVVEWCADGSACILAGERGLSEVMTVNALPRPSDTLSVCAIDGSTLTIRDLIIETDDAAIERLMTDYTSSQLDESPRYTSLDGEFDRKLAVAGGNYELAQVGADLIYMGGARTNGTHWRPGMLKGRLIPTGFDEYYKLEWFDATGRKLSGANYAEVDPMSATLRLVFPELGATMRFARNITTDAVTDSR